MTTILIVDDREDSRLHLKAMLVKRGFNVELTSNGHEAIEICIKGGIDAVLMDMNMPELDGCDATLMLKSITTTQHIPIIIISAHPVKKDLERINECVNDGFLAKPISETDLIGSLSKILHVDYQPAIVDDPDLVQKLSESMQANPNRAAPPKIVDLRAVFNQQINESLDQPHLSK